MKPIVRTTLEEDLQRLGVPLNINESARIAGLGEQDDEDDEKDDDEEDDMKEGKKGKPSVKEQSDDDEDDKEDDDEVEEGKKRKLKKEQCDDDEEDDEDDDEVDEGKKKRSKVKTEDVDVFTENDPIDGPVVTKELLDRIEGLNFEALTTEDIDELIEGLKQKQLPEGNAELREQAESVVRKIMETAAHKLRKFKAGATAKETIFKCPEGKRKAPGSDRVCIPAHVAAGGVGNLKKEGRLKRLWGRLAGGLKSQRKSARVEKRRAGLRKESLLSPLAQELLQVTEGMHVQEGISVRDEIVERVIMIFNFLNEEFMDKSVKEIYEDQANRLIDSFEGGRLDEDILDNDEFITELEPALKLITKSLGKLEDEDESGNE